MIISDFHLFSDIFKQDLSVWEFPNLKWIYIGSKLRLLLFKLTILVYYGVYIVHRNDIFALKESVLD